MFTQNICNESEVINAGKGKKRVLRWAGGGALDTAPRVRARRRYSRDVVARSRQVDALRFCNVLTRCRQFRFWRKKNLCTYSEGMFVFFCIVFVSFE